MFLKRIVLHGFKSFADRTEFEFGAGVTAIVGPNGCGKSNVLDAVRWVLGEQSARSLRGGKMSDVIFSGSRSRKPANFAEVTLIFDNRAGFLRSDQAEVTVGRVLYRSGESEYRLNGNAVRLKEIRELLLDTGVGVDAYSVIEQGRVDLLLQASPVERREIFEEAAGISRYKFRRLEAQRKLERTQSNLQRLQDILDELEKRLRSVRLAAGKARNWQQYDARLRELRSSFSLAEYHELEQTRVGAEATVAARAAELSAGRAQLAERDAEAAEIERARQAQDERLQQAEAELLALQGALSTLVERIAQGTRRLPELAELRERRRQQAAEVEQRLAQQAERLGAGETDLTALRATEADAEARMAEVQAARRGAESALDEARRAAEAEKVAMFEAARRTALLQNEQENCDQQFHRLLGQVQRLENRQQEIACEQETLATTIGQLAERVARLEQEIAATTADLRRDEERLAELLSAAEQVDEQIGSAKQERSAVLSRLGVLEELERKLEGVDQGTRAVLAWREQPESGDLVLGLAADLLRIDDPRVAVLQAVLATFETHVVVRESAEFVAALRACGELPGALRVLALDRLHRAATPISYEHAPGYVARAADWVACAAEFRPLAEHLLGRVFIVADLDAALRLSSEALSGCVFVTLAGETVGADGRLTFGAAQAAAGLISRKAEVRQLQGERDDVEGRLVQLTRRRMELDEATSDAQLHKQGLLQQVATLQREHAEARHERARVEEARQRLERETRVIAGETANLRRAMDEITARLQQLQADRAAAAAAQEAHEALLSARAATVTARETELAALVHAGTEAAVARGRAAEKRSAAAQALGELRRQAQALERERESAEREAEQAGEQIARAEREVHAAQAQEAEQQAALAACHAQVADLRGARQQLRERLEACGAAGRAVQQRVEALEADLHAVQMTLREAQVRRENLLARIQDELGIDLAALYTNYAHAEQDWEAVKAEIEELRGKIARLGNVNLDAIAELEELSPRYDQLVAQRDDLNRASTSLQALIAELDQESRVRFAAAFEQIRANFQDMFRKLFGGGKADILLEDPEQPLECGIEIIARPPGKEPQSISLLSGGEKTMTAVALLMAVFRSRPSPFAILDEVDAALDEANVERFNGVLQDFLSQTQFVMITHHKRTMAAADVLYGVTMEEPGVSKRVSVRFDDRVQTPNVA